MVYSSKFHAQNILHIYLLLISHKFHSTLQMKDLCYFPIKKKVEHKFMSLPKAKSADKYQSSFICLNTAIKPLSFWWEIWLAYTILVWKLP